MAVIVHDIRTVGQARRNFRLAWVSDIHLDVAQGDSFLTLIEDCRHYDGMVISGDIANSTTVEGWLDVLSQQVHKPIWFVLGNHDFYGSSIGCVRARISNFCQTRTSIAWLTERDPMPLVADVCILGVDGWGDGRNGDFLATPIRLNDADLIHDFMGLPRIELLRKLMALGADAAERLKEQLASAKECGFNHIIVATHVPPFIDACRHRGQVSTAAWHPDFTCAAVGSILLSFVDSNPAVRVLVLCGHTHGAGDVVIRQNLRVLTAGATYGKPALAGVVEF